MRHQSKSKQPGANVKLRHPQRLSSRYIDPDRRHGHFSGHLQTRTRRTTLKTAVVPCYLLTVRFLLAAGPATEQAPPRAARSVHLSYPAAPATAFYNEVTIRQSTPGSYFMCCGFSHGYFGMQDLGDHKILLFSVWDPTKGDKPGNVPDAERVEVLYQGEGVAIKRFGGEGTGGQSGLQFDWKVGQTYRYLLTAKVDGQKTEYAAWFFMPDTNNWKHLATFRTITGGDALRGLYSFIEDFRRDGNSARETRRAEFGNGWTLDTDGRWHPLTAARFTAADATWEAKDSIDAGFVGDCFYLQTGGNTRETLELNATIERPATDAKPPELPKQ
jgi:hypothetical protein